MSRRSAHQELSILGGLAALALGAIGAAVAAPSPVGAAAAVALAVQAGHAGRRARTGAPISPRALAFAIAIALFGIANGGLGDATGLPPWRALAALAAYPLLGRAVLQLVESYQRVRHTDVVVEAALVGAAAIILLRVATADWHPVAAPAAWSEGRVGVAALLVGLDVGISIVAVRSLVHRDARRGSLGVLNVGIALLLAAHLTDALNLARGAATGSLSTTVAIGAVACFTLAQLHPNAAIEPTRLAREHALFSTGHAGLVVVAILATPGVLAIQALRHLVASVTVAAGAVVSAAILACYLLDVLRERATTEHLATHDALTKLPNRTLFTDRLERAIAHARRNDLPVGLLFVDLDGFKAVNDSYGHAAGDVLMKMIAERLLGCRRDEDTVARLSGDEFAILLPHIARPDDVVVVAERVLAALREPATIAGERLLVSASVGIAVYPHDGDSPAAMLACADAAMYRAKETGGNDYEIFSAKLASQAHARLRIESAVFDGLERHEFVLHYQPIYEMATGTITGAEALVRWNHPEDGLLLPGHFIPVAEQSDLIVLLGEQVLLEACQELRRWEDLGIHDCTISVNVSSRHFTHGLVEAVTAALRNTGADPTRLVLELTESTAVDKLDAVVAALEELRSLGIRAAIDDFGTGYCGLRYLGALPVDYLKIDKSFVQAMTPSAAAIVAATIAMGHSLGLGLVAEGVETEEQRRFLTDRGCDHFQGFLASRPMPAADLVDLLRAQRSLGNATGDAPVHEVDTLRFEPPLLRPLVGSGQRTVAVHDPPPRQPVAVLGQEGTDRTSRSPRAAATSDLAV